MQHNDLDKELAYHGIGSAMVKYGCGFTLAVRPYEMARVDVGVELPCPESEVKQTMKRAIHLCEAHAKIKLQEWKEMVQDAAEEFVIEGIFALFGVLATVWVAPVIFFEFVYEPWHERKRAERGYREYIAKEICCPRCARPYAPTLKENLRDIQRGKAL